MKIAFGGPNQLLLRKNHLLDQSCVPSSRRSAQVRMLIWFSPTFGVIAWLGFWQSAVIPHDPSVFCTGHVGEFKGDVIEVFEVGSSFYNSSREVIRFWLNIFSGRGNSVVFHLTFPQVREPVWEMYKLLNITIPLLYCRTGEIATGWVWGHWTHCDSSFDHLTSRSLYFKWASMLFGISLYQCLFRTSVLWVSGSLSFSCPPGYSCLVKGYGSHQRRMDRRLTSKRFGIVTRSLLKGMWLAFPALKGLWVHELHKSRNWLMTYGIQWSLYFFGFRVITENGGASGDQICDWETAPLFPWVWRMSGRVQACWHQVLLWVLVTKPSTRPASTFNCWTISLAWLWFDFSKNT